MEPKVFGSSVGDHWHDELSLDFLLIEHPAATTFFQVVGQPFVGDMVIVDNSIEPRPKSVVMASMNGDYYFNRLNRLPEDEELLVYGVVTYGIRRLD